ncbi:helix-turn-helix transcriptional regulator [Granulibacter bethesdensis]|uniref:helix-turn-helix transcriptional regulator n=1 Tax=Granulibacter bethesdensis TaxID=364410 RepID=UPI00046CA605|nr:AlpA family phage regulatory protein [Granulibacter bethesdensis]
MIRSEEVSVEGSRIVPGERLLRLSEVREKTGLATSTIYKWGSQGRFPRQISLGTAVRWRESEIDTWIAGLRHTGE